MQGARCRGGSGCSDSWGAAPLAACGDAPSALALPGQAVCLGVVLSASQ